ncbi:heterokaryon incompatibility protein-domain-containing protein [Diaporthe sp. PMI_573]|nr:heterokaryon incompatibility protein-domain-containing protein [Diaporthaceae sp. PMI_573]
MFTYESLNQGHREIRLVRFVPSVVSVNGPGDLPETISLELRHVSLNDDITYAALSYTWGSARDAIEISLNGARLYITKNLRTALQRFRDDRLDSWLWIDAICIDQSNSSEKAWQVIEMREIFSRASVVYIWLGLGCAESDFAMDFVSRLGPTALACDAAILWNNTTMKEEVSCYIEKRVASQDFDDALRAPSLLKAGISNILMRDYWHRIWTFQELALSKEAVVSVGTRSVALEIFDATFTAIWYCLKSRLYSMCPKWEQFGSGLGLNLYRIKGLDIHRYLRQSLAPTTMRLADVLWETCGAPDRPHYTATDPRDILFGLLGVLPQEQAKGLRVDYSKSFVQVFTVLTRTLISDGDKDRSSFHLDWCNPGETTGSLPTWVPDWREVGMYGVRVYPINHRQTFNATDGMLQPTPALSSECDCSKILRRVGCRVDEITEVMQPPEWIQVTAYDPSWIKDADSWFHSIATFVELGPESGPHEDYVWRTIMRNELHKNIRIPRQNRVAMDDGTLGLCRKIMRLEYIDAGNLTEDEAEFIRNGPLQMGFGSALGALSDQQVASFASLWRQVLGSQNRDRTLFKTAKGMLGLGHVAVEAGDTVTLLWGVCSPIILRGRDHGGFYFHGDAYVDGIMQGEYLATSPTNEEFSIY